MLRGEREFGLSHVLGLFREEERQHHDQSRGEQDQEVGADRGFEGSHHDGFAAGLAGDLPGVEAGQGHADEVHEVVSCEGQGQGEGTGEDRDADDVEPHPLEEPQHDGCHGPEGEEREQHVVGDVFRDRGGDESRALEPLEECEVEDPGEGDSAPYGTPAPEYGGVAEREDQARDVHVEETRDEGEGYGEEDGGDDDHGLPGVDELREVLEREGGVGGDVEEGRGDGGAEQPEDHRDGGRGGEPEGVVEVEQQDVSEHHAEEEHHDLLKGELRRVEDAAAGDLHHAAGGERSDEDSGRGDPEDRAAGCDFRADGRVEEVDGVVGDTHDDAHHGQDGQDDDDGCKQGRHGEISVPFLKVSRSGRAVFGEVDARLPLRPRRGAGLRRRAGDFRERFGLPGAKVRNRYYKMVTAVFRRCETLLFSLFSGV